MYLHIGQDTVVYTRNIVGVFDLDNASQGKDTRGFLHKSEQKGRVSAIGDDLPRSFVLLADGNVYLTPISAGTISKRNALPSSCRED